MSSSSSAPPDTPSSSEATTTTTAPPLLVTMDRRENPLSVSGAETATSASTQVEDSTAIDATPPIIPAPVVAVMTVEECLYGVSPEYVLDGSQRTTASIDYHDHLHHVIDLTMLRKLASRGYLDDHELRGMVWRVLLNMVPGELARWDMVLHEKRALYASLCQDLFVHFHQEGSRLPSTSPPRPRRRRAASPTTKFEEEQHDESHSSVSLDDHDSVTLAPSSAVPTLPKLDPEILPPAVQAEWQRSGRDLHVLVNLTSGWNALRVQDSMGSPDLSSPVKKAAADDQVNGADSDGAAVHDNGDPVVAAGPRPPTAPSSAPAAANNNNKPYHNVKPESYQDFIETAILLDEIRKDVVRTHPDLRFYLEPELGQRRRYALERILLVWSKYNRGVKYVQGMNEIVATLYYVLAHDPMHAAHAEADAYWLLHAVLSEFHDVFVPDLDMAASGLQGRMIAMQQLLHKHDPQTLSHLLDLGVEPYLFAVRWWTTLLAREFLLPDLCRLWDSMFASTHKDNFLRYVCVTMVLDVRERLLVSDFSTCLKLLQKWSCQHSMEMLLESSRALWIYESQITHVCVKGQVPLSTAMAALRPPKSVKIAFGVLNNNGNAGNLNNSTQHVREEAQKQLLQARDKVTSSAQRWWGQASRFYKTVQDLNERQMRQQQMQRSLSNASDDVDENNNDKKDPAQAAAEAVAELATLAIPDDDDVYLDAILNA